jgi:DNA-binding MarR family transcriptional regulator
MRLLVEHIRGFVHVIGKLGEKRFVEHGMPINLKQHYLMSLVSKSDEITQTELAEHLKLDKSAVLREIDDLENRGLLMRISDAKDRRKKILQLTDAGKMIHIKCEHLINDLLAELGDGLSENDLRSFIHVVTHMSSHGNNLLK